MTTRTNTPTRVPQEEVVVEPITEVSSELREMVDRKMSNLIEMWKERREDAIAVAETAAPTLPGGYRYWDCLLLGPFQSSSADLPSKVVAANERVAMVGLIWINPDRTPDGGVSGRVVLADRDLHFCFEMINLSNLTNTDSYCDTINFGANPAEFTYLIWEFGLPDPGIHPKMYEVHFAVDVILSGQPFATFSTWHWDPEGDGSIPGFFQPDAPAMPPHFDHDIPARFLLHRA